jgi:hypothetical protein
MGYRTQDGLADYGFSIEFQPEMGWRVYIIFDSFHQDYNSHELPHQSVEDGRRYVDWAAKLGSLGEARIVAALWAELAQRYQRTQEQHALYVKMIEHYQRTRGQRKAKPADRDRVGDLVGTNEAGSEHEDDGSVIPHPRLTADSLIDH